MSSFQRARPYTVLPISPSLAALYSFHSTSESKNLDWCRKCGSYLLDGTAQIRTIRLKSSRRKRPRSNLLRATCTRCSWENDIFLEDAPSSNPISSGDKPAATSQVETPRATTQVSSTTPASQTSKSKRKSDLQALIARNRKKEASEQTNSTVSGGLAAFLSGL